MRRGGAQEGTLLEIAPRDDRPPKDEPQNERAEKDLSRGEASRTSCASDPRPAQVTDEDPANKYGLDYYLALARDVVDLGVHGLAIKDMAGLLTPLSADVLVSALRAEFPDVPIHVHTHDSQGLGVASMVAAAKAGADVVDGAVDAMGGLTSQPALGAIAAAARGGDAVADCLLDADAYAKISNYWDVVRATLYGPFESGQLATASDVKVHEIPGGQYTNLLFQSRMLGLADKFEDVKAKYAMANRLLGDIPKVTPSSKVVGDLAQFMVANDLDEADVGTAENVARLPDSVVDYLKGSLGTPPGGFPEPLRTDVLEARGLEALDGRPGAQLDLYDFDEAFDLLSAKYADTTKRISVEDVLSHALYPGVFADFMDHRLVYGDVDHLPTHVSLGAGPRPRPWPTSRALLSRSVVSHSRRLMLRRAIDRPSERPRSARVVSGTRARGTTPTSRRRRSTPCPRRSTSAR